MVAAEGNPWSEVLLRIATLIRRAILRRCRVHKQQRQAVMTVAAAAQQGEAPDGAHATPACVSARLPAAQMRRQELRRVRSRTPIGLKRHSCPCTTCLSRRRLQASDVPGVRCLKGCECSQPVALLWGCRGAIRGGTPRGILDGGSESVAGFLRGCVGTEDQP